MNNNSEPIKSFIFSHMYFVSGGCESYGKRPHQNTTSDHKILCFEITTSRRIPSNSGMFHFFNIRYFTILTSVYLIAQKVNMITCFICVFSCSFGCHQWPQSPFVGLLHVLNMNIYSISLLNQEFLSYQQLFFIGQIKQISLSVSICVR